MSGFSRYRPKEYENIVILERYDNGRTEDSIYKGEEKNAVLYYFNPIKERVEKLGWFNQESLEKAEINNQIYMRSWRVWRNREGEQTKQKAKMFLKKNFRIDNYRFCEALALEGWLDHLSFRSRLIKKYQEHVSGKAFGIQIKSFKDACKLLINPEYFWHRTERASEYFHDLAEHGTMCATVRELNLFDVISMYKEVRAKSYPDSVDEKRPVSPLLSSDLNSLEYDDVNELSSWVYSEYVNEQEPDEYLYLKLDFSAPNDVLEDDFRALIRSIRKEKKNQSTCKVVTNKTANRWVAARVLAYADIKHFALLYDLDMTDAQIAAMLFPDDLKSDVDIVSSLRKTTKKIYRELFESAKVYEVLRNQLYGTVM